MFPKTFVFYIARHFASWLLATIGVFAIIVFLFDFLELLRRAMGKPDATTWVVAKMAFLQLPEFLFSLMPFLFLFGTMLCLWRLNRHAELIAARAAGFSIWQMIGAMALVTVLFTTVEWGAGGPISSLMSRRFEQLERHVLKRQASVFSLSDSGLWLLQKNLDGYTILHTHRIQERPPMATEVSLYFFNEQNIFLRRLEAKKAHMMKRAWQLNDVVIFTPGLPAQYFREYAWETNFEISKIEQQFLPPQALSLWQLPEFIQLLERSGVPARAHRAYLYSLWARPFLYLAMIIFGTLFSLQLTRARRSLRFALSGLGTGFVFYVVDNISMTLGISGDIPLFLSVIGPIGIALLVSTAALLHYEDG